MKSFRGLSQKGLFIVFLVAYMLSGLSVEPHAFAADIVRITLRDVQGQQGPAAVNQQLGVIREIQVQGNKKIERDAILAKVKSKVGDDASRASVAEDIRALYAMGFFDDIAVDYDNGVLIFRVKERPTITSIEFEGNDQISSTDLRDVIKLREYSILNINKVKEDIDAIQKNYEEKGFYLARVTYDLRPGDKADEVKLVYRISDFEKVRIKKINFINNRRFSEDVLKGILRNTKEGNFFSWMSSSGNFKESAFKQDLQILTYYYLNEGYVKFRYENPVVTVSEDKKWLFISIYVDEGERYNVGDIDFGGDLLFDKSELQNTVRMTKGQVFSIQKRNEDIQALTEKYQDLGYAFVNVIPKMAIHDETRLVDIRYDFEKGNLVHFGEISITGNTKTRDKVIRRELRVREGELYHGTRLRQSRERVERLGFFAPGEVVFNTVTRKDNKDIVDLEISIKERSTGTVTLGMGYGSIQKFFLTAQVAEINLFGRGQSLSLSGQYAADRESRSLSLGFTEPYLMDTNWSAGIDLYFVSFRIPDRYLEFKNGAALKFGHPLTDDINAYFTYKFEHLKLDKIKDPTLDVSADEGDLSSVGFAIVRDKRNNRFETTRGDYQSLATEYAGIGGNKFFAKAIAEGRYYRPLFENLVFRTKLEFGQVFKTSDESIPPSEKFYLGGPNNLKGFDTFTVSPRSAAGTPIGGETEFLYIAEVEFPLIREAGVKFVVFYDMGNSYASFDEFSRFETIKKDAGFGLRWFSPIGPLRFEWGFPINPVGNERDLSFNFFIGPPF